MIVTNLISHAGGFRVKWLRAALLLLATLAICFAAMVVLDRPAQEDIFNVPTIKDSGAEPLRDAIDDTAPRGYKITFVPDVSGAIIFSKEDGA